MFQQKILFGSLKITDFPELFKKLDAPINYSNIFSVVQNRLILIIIMVVMMFMLLVFMYRAL